MNGILDGFLVGIALLLSVGYALLSLGPRSLRRRLLAALSFALGRAPAVLGLRGAAERLAIAAAGKSHGACGGCDDCGTNAAGATATQPPTRDRAAAEVRVPVAKIGRRARGA
ncbi:MAG: DUF6587 family protein [Steroidobacteraceae bacterium]